MQTLSIILCTSIIATVSYYIADAQATLRGCGRLGRDPVEPWGDVPEVPAAARKAGERRVDAAAGLAHKDVIARRHDGGL